MNSWESGLVIGVVSIVLSFLYQSITTRTKAAAQYYSGPWELPIEFGLASWILNFYRSGLVFSFFGALAIIVFMEEGTFRMFTLVLPTFFAFLTGAGLFFDSKKKVTITKEEFTYRSAFSTFEVKLSKIKGISTGSGLIFIDTGERRKKSIPMMFQDSGKMLAILQSKAQPAVMGNG